MIHPIFSHLDISSDGIVLNVKTGRTTRGTPNNRGYLNTFVHHKGKRFCKSVHRLVLETFCPIRGDGMEANHKDGNKHNNNISNLEWCSKSYNAIHRHRVLGIVGGRTKLTPYQRREVRKLFLSLVCSQREKVAAIKKVFGISSGTILCIAYRFGVYSDARLVAK